MNGCLGTILIDRLTKKESVDISKNGFSAAIKASPTEKYRSGDNQESIIPFRVVSE